MFNFKPAVEIPPTAGLPLHYQDFFSTAAGDLSKELAAFLGTPAVGIECSGTASLIVILETLRRLSSRTVVIVPAYTCPLVVFAVARCGLKLQLCDVCADGFELEPEMLADLCDSNTLAVIPTHLGGRVADLTPIIAIAHRCGAYVIEDAAQALGAHDQGTSVGLQGDAGFFSLAAGKGLSLFEGGLWVAADEALRLEFLRTSRQIVPVRRGWESLRCLELLGYAALYHPFGLRYVYGNALRRALRHGDSVAAAGDYFSPDIPLHRVSPWRQSVGSRALARLPSFQNELAVQAAKRLPQLAAIPGMKVLSDSKTSKGTWPVFIAVLASEVMRDRVLGELWGAGLGAARMFAYALPDYSYLKPWVSEQAVPNARQFAACSLTITNSPWLDDVRFEKIMSTLRHHCT